MFFAALVSFSTKRETYNEINLPHETSCFDKAWSRPAFLAWSKDASSAKIIVPISRCKLVKSNPFHLSLYVAAIVWRFTEIHPEREVLIRGEKRRMRLYNLIFRRRYLEIEKDFQIWGYADDDEWEPYDPQKSFESLKIKRKVL